MRVIVMDKISYAVRSLSEVTSITYNAGTITIVGKDDENSQSITLTTTSVRSIVRIMEN
jgi:hypothetical protein